ncbi:MAG: M28 family peptidase [Myxococcota bacterium]
MSTKNGKQNHGPQPRRGAHRSSRPLAVRAVGPAALVVALGAPALGCSEDATGHPPDADEMLSSIEALVDLGVRMPGTDASVQAAQYVHDHFVESGLTDVAIEQTDTVVWSADRWGLSVEGEDVPAYFMQHTFHEGEPTTFSTGPDGRSAPLVYVGDGSNADFDGVDVSGKIVVSDVRFHRFGRDLVDIFGFGIHDPEGTFDEDYEFVDPYSRRTFPRNYQNAVENGAVGFIGILTDYLDRNEYHNEAYATYRFDSPMDIPGLWVSPSVGAELAQRIEEAPEPLTANMVLEGQLEEAVGRSVVGYVRGRTDEIVMVQSHHDSNTAGAVEDASGTALVLALARHYASLPERRRTLLFTTMDTHFTDYASHFAFIERHIEQEDILANLTLEHIGREVEETADGLVPTDTSVLKALFVTTEVPGLSDIAMDAFIARDVARTVGMPANNGIVGLPTDADHFHAEGVPVVNLVGAPMYLYDSADTLDKVAVDQLEPVARASIDVLGALDRLPRSDLEEW